jgi:transposase
MLFISPVSFAGGETHKSPILDRAEVQHKAPENLSGLSLEQLQNERDLRQRDLMVIKQASDEPEVAKQQLLATIMAHDDVRLSIAEVIPLLIKDYEIEGDFRDDLMGYSNTFNVDMREARKDVHTLNDYKSYDFRFSAVYMSMMFKFNENPEFHKKLVSDMSNPETAIGKYRKDLDESYAKVEHDKYLIQNIYSISELEQAIALIDEEISRRKKAEL